jgi:long-chain acyl-CoA synthetase
VQIRQWNEAALQRGRRCCCRCRCHVYGNVGVQSLAFLSGAAIALVPNPRDLPDLIATIRRVKPTFFNGVPTLYIAP